MHITVGLLNLKMTCKVIHITTTLRNRFKVLYFPFVTNAVFIVFTTKRNL